MGTCLQLSLLAYSSLGSPWLQVSNLVIPITSALVIQFPCTEYHFIVRWAGLLVGSRLRVHACPEKRGLTFTLNPLPNPMAETAIDQDGKSTLT